MKGQEVSVTKNLYGIQLGLVSASFQYETKLQRKIALHTEIGLDLITATKSYDYSSIKDEKATLISPYINVEPRWYYSLDRRERLKRNTANNSANYISLKTDYHFNRSPLSNNGNFDVPSTIQIIPKYGIRRSFAKNFNYEFSFGIGYQYNVDGEKYNFRNDDAVIDLQARIGYNF